MKQTIKTIIFLAAMILTAGQAWGEDYGYIAYTQGTDDGGSLAFYKDAACTSEITITDGNATIGVRSSGQNTWFAFNEIHLTLIAPAAGFDYAKGLEDFLAGIETLDATAAKVRAIELFDLNGRRINTARQGIVIVKKHMSDGSVITEKVIRK